MRAAVIELRRPGSPFRFVLFPMVHIGEARYYAEVRRLLRECDLVVAEGILGRSRRASALTMAYRLTKGGRLGLVQQNLDLKSLRVPVRYPDMRGEDFDKAVGTIPFRQRWMLWITLPVYVPYVFAFGTRARLARALELDDDHGLGGYIEGFDEWEEVLVDQRDRLLIEELSAIHEEHHAEPLTVGVVYGAQHMIAVVHVMSARFGYVPRAARWVTVFDI